jgi:hypothetical protein
MEEEEATTTTSGIYYVEVGYKTAAERWTGNKSLLVYRNRKKEEVYVLVTVRVYFNYGLRYSLL